MQPQNILYSQNNLEKKRTKLEVSCSLASDYTTKLQKSKQCISGTKKTHKSMEQNREPINKPTHLQSINLQQRRQEYTIGKRYKNRLKDLKIRLETIELLEKNKGRTF